MSKTPKNKHARHRKNERSGRPTPPHAPRGGGAPNRGRLRTLTATLEKNRKGFGFLIFDHAEWEDLYIPPNEARRFFPGDRLLVALTSHPGGAEVVSLKLLEHRYKELVGRFISGTVVYESRKGVHFEIPTQRGALFGGKRIPEGHWVRVKLVYEGPHQMVGEVQEVYGESVPASADVEMIAGEFGLIEPHSKEAVSEALAFGKIVPEESLKQKGRKNLRDLPFITIDGETARDFDDAVHVARTAKGFTLWVAIADVSHYVKPGSTIDKEAFARGTSVYFPERAFHMLPSALSENLCSLRPNEPRLALVCEMDFDKEGERTGTLIYDAVIESKRRTTYTEIEKEGAAEWPDLFALYKILRRARTNRGSIDFELPDAEVVTDIRPGKYGEPLEIENRSRLDSHRLIEEFMIAANEAVTVWALERNLPFIYRVHAEPSPEALVKFAELAAQVGEEAPFIERPKTERGRGQGHGHGHGAKQGRSRSFKKARAHQASAPRSIAPKVLADFVRKLEGRSTQALLNTALLRAMKQAVYTDIHGIHFGLASTAYTHFTSPIRRYPDLIVHRLLKEAVQAERESNQRKSGHSGGVMSAKLREWRDELGKQAEHCSYRERLAADADREAIRVKQVRIMQKHLGDVFEGKISGLAIKGIFVQITSPFVEGLIPMDALSDDQYEYNEERMVISGRKKKRTFQIGDKIEVQVVRADFEKRQVELGLAELASS